MSVDVEFENLEKVDVEAVSTEKQYECVICRQMSSSSSSRPIGEAVLLQPTTGEFQSLFYFSFEVQFWSFKTIISNYSGV